MVNTVIKYSISGNLNLFTLVGLLIILIIKYLYSKVKKDGNSCPNKAVI